MTSLLAARRLGLAVLSVAVIASVVPASQAATAPTARGGQAPRFIADAAARARVELPARAGGRTGVISGVVNGLAGSGLAGACVTAVGEGSRVIVRTAQDGRYLFGGLRPGQYRVYAQACAGTSPSSGGPLVGASEVSTVDVRARQIDTPAPISSWHFDEGWLTQPKEPLSAIAESRRGSISGTVTGEGHPLRSVCAAAIGYGGQLAVAGFAVTSKAGTYRISRLRPGRYLVEFVAGYGQCSNDGNWLPQIYGQVNSLFPTGDAKPVRVRVDKVTRGINAHLKRGAEISGQVRATSGKPLSGICVTLSNDIFGSQLIEVGTMSTGKAGRYFAHGLFPAGYQVEFSIGCRNKGNYAFQWWRDASSEMGATTIPVRGTQRVTDINATLEPGATITGVVNAVTATGRPVRGVCVGAVASDFNQYASDISSRTGTYRLNGLAAGRYQIQFDPTCGGNDSSKYLFVQQTAAVGAGRTLTGFDAILPIGGGISGVVTDARGRGAGGVCVLVDDYNGDSAWTRPNGSYSLLGVATGSYPVEFVGGCGNVGSLAPQFYPDQPDGPLAKVIKFRPDSVTPNIDARMLPGGTVAGLVTNRSGHRLTGICVTAYSLGQPFFGTDAGTESGRYVISNLAPGSYRLSFSCAGYGAEYFPSQANPAAASLISVNPGVITTVPATRMSRAGMITGRVTNQAGKPLGDVCVEAAVGRPRSIFTLSGLAFSLPNGRYRMGGLAPGTYVIQFSVCAPGALAPQWYRGQSTETAATGVRVLAGQTDAGIDAVLAPGGSITGKVRGPSGKPANAICVEAFSARAQYVGLTQTGRSGRYRLNGLSRGRWSLSFGPCFNPKPDIASLVRPATVGVVPSKTTTGVNFKLPLGGSVSGRVISSGRPIGGVCVLAVPVDPNGSFGSGYTSGNGSYRVPHLAAGRYHIYFSDPYCDTFQFLPAPFAPQWYPDQPREATAAAVHVSAGAVTAGIGATLASYGSVTGTVGTRTHAAVVGECVTAVPFRDPVDLLFGAPVPPEMAITGRGGHYTLATLAPGRYKIEFSTGCGDAGFATQWWDNARSASAARIITIESAAIGGADATLRR